MKRIFIYFIALAVTISFTACSEELDENSVFEDPVENLNGFDVWIKNNLTVPYNIQLFYRMEDVESNLNYNLVPASYDKSVKLAVLIKHLCLDAYDEVAGRNLIPGYFPKVLSFIGSPGVNPNGTILLGMAEAGLKITLYYVNAVDLDDLALLYEWYFKTIHHEFGHILHQTKSYPTEFVDISGDSYLGGSWNSSDNNNYLTKGFISQYSANEANDDFVELLAHYILYNEAWWNTRLSAAGSAGAARIRAKLEIVKTYMISNWDIDIDDLRRVIQRRVSEISQLNYNL
ncbi:MAG: putative zinc-binding metallopeptidase [Prevotellaceae bacterium]|jgi:substrate import-associated zinc metallohydrolase lipoprotein|nr:putative zinc-binding metallopeptidase [Prevotellaceae bacterium]